MVIEPRNHIKIVIGMFIPLLSSACLSSSSTVYFLHSILVKNI